MRSSAGGRRVSWAPHTSSSAVNGHSKDGLLQQRNTNRLGVVSKENQAPAAAQRDPFSDGRSVEGNPRTQAIFRGPPTRPE